MKNKKAEMIEPNNMTVQSTGSVPCIASSVWVCFAVFLVTNLSELQEANQQLQADIDMERRLEKQRVEFFASASHECIPCHQ